MRAWTQLGITDCGNIAQQRCVSYLISLPVSIRFRVPIPLPSVQPQEQPSASVTQDDVSMHGPVSAPIPGPVNPSPEYKPKTLRQDHRTEWQVGHTSNPLGSLSRPGFQSLQSAQNGRILETGILGRSSNNAGNVYDGRRDDSFFNVIGTGNHVCLSLFHGESSVLHFLCFIFLFVGSSYMCVSGTAQAR